MRSRLFVVSAPSGAGKTSLIKALRERLPTLRVSVSHTTRPPRPGEVPGVNYHFVDTPTFEGMVAAGQFLEHARVFDNLYGTSRHAVDTALAAGHDVVLELDWQGARRIRALYPRAVTIFITPPSLASLRQRLEVRGQDAPEVIARRMQAAEEELSHAPEYGFVIINDDFGSALGQLEDLVRNAPAQ